MSSEDLHNFVIDSSHKSVHDILATLCFISNIKAGDKIDTTCLELQSQSIWTRIRRTLQWGAQSKEVTLKFLKKAGDDAIVVADRCFKSGTAISMELGEKIIIALDESKKGLLETRKTYSDLGYVGFCSQLDAHVSILDTKIKDIRNRYLNKNVKENENNKRTK